MKTFFSKDKLEYLISDEYVYGSQQDDNINVLLDQLVKQIEAAGLRYEYEERAAILEYEGNIKRYDADRIAAIEIMERMRL